MTVPTASPTVAAGPDVGRDVSPDLVLYDGVCGLCDGAVRFILKRDRGRQFVFAPLQSEEAKALLHDLGEPPGDMSTMYLVRGFRGEDPQLFRRSRAVLGIAKHLGFPWSWGSWLRILPSLLLDPFYRLVAWGRYRVFGKLDACAIPRPEWRDRFLWEGA